MRMRKIEKFLCIVLASAALVAGCQKNGQIKSPDAIREQALDYLDELYEDRFVVQSMMVRSWAEDYDTIIVTSEKYHGQTFLVRRFHQRNEIAFTDNYFTLYMVDDAERYGKELAEKAGLEADVSVAFTEGERPKALEADADFSDYVKMGGSPFCYITVIMNESTQKEEQLAFVGFLAEQRFQCNVVFRYQSSSWRYGVNSDYEIQDYN